MEEFSMNPVVELENVSVRYGNTSVLSELSLAVHENEILVILGPSGCGKSSLLRVILGLLVPERGIVKLSDQMVSRDARILKPPEDRNLAMVFQDLALWPHLTVHGNLNFGLKARKVAREQREELISEMLKRVDLQAYRERYPAELSGGQRQRVAIARALVLDHLVVLFDEPLSNLDLVLKRELLAMFRELLKERSLPALYVTHDVREAVSLGDRVAVLMEGKVIQVGIWDELCTKPAHSFVKDLVSGLRWAGTF
jgi:ABC-type sugar transport system ATPase subunit